MAWAIAYRFLGAYMHRAVTSPHHLRVEKLTYRAIGINPDKEQSSAGYTRSLLALSAVSIVGVFALQRLQGHLWLAGGMSGVSP